MNGSQEEDWASQIDDLRKKYLTPDSNREINNLSESVKSSDAAISVEQCDNNVENLSKKNEKLMLQQQKRNERIKRKEEAEQLKNEKRARTEALRNLKPENCLKLIKVYLDTEIMKKSFGEVIFNQLQEKSISIHVREALVSDIVTWTMDMENINEPIPGFINSESMQVLLIIDWKEFVESIALKTLLNKIENFHSILNEKRIFLAIVGMEKYYRYKNKQKNDAPNKPNLYDTAAHVTRRDVESALGEIQLFYSVSHRFVENDLELSDYVFHLTKAIAQIPNKMEQNAKFDQAKYFMSEDNRDTVKVAKNGGGLASLWKRIICTFPLASLETAEAIANVYPSYVSLMKAYDQAEDTKNKEMLLSNIPIRRGAHPLSSNRCIGPELSKKLFNFFNNSNGEHIL